MSNDRFISFKDKVPTIKEIRSISTNFIGPDIGQINEQFTKKDFFIININGINSFPFKGLKESCAHTFSNEERWIEFSKTGRKNLIVSTREADEFTNTIASGIAKCIARYYEADYQHG